MEVPLVIVLLHLLQPRQNRIHSLFHIGLCISIYEYDVNDGLLLDLPYAPNKHTTYVFLE